eukprot:TRINITY_DN12804_c0_g1_i1.p1 TRINITY_DN12804_c0_g1~~TRINITY_DN12804_c0_g1_i1.p1  ORF type:complete len:591 (+),score=123.35 TRINITY_DN12804_c0_g1_i1:26-1798(+)
MLLRTLRSVTTRSASCRLLRQNRTFCSNDDENPLRQPREVMEHDVLIVGGGPAGLSAAIRLKQLAQQNNSDLSVCLIDKGSEIGAHILSGNVLETRALNELIPDWREKEAPLDTPAGKDEFHFLTSATGSFRLPIIPPTLHNHGNYIISLSKFCQWLAKQAEDLGVEIYPGFSAKEVLYDDNGAVAGIATSDVGIGKDGKPKESFQRGMELRAKQTLLAEGVRGSLSELVMAKFNLRQNCDFQTYGLGLKEVWEVDKSVHEAGKIVHTIGYPMQSLMKTKGWGGGFLYHMKPNLVLAGYVVGLDYQNPYINPYEEFQLWKSHPKLRPLFENGEPVAYGARTINEGGYQSIPKLTFPGGALIGCSAGFLNVPKVKGTHTAMKSGILAAESVYEALTQATEGDGQKEVVEYEKRVKDSWIYSELHGVRNIQPAFQWGLLPWAAFSGANMFFLKGKEPFTLRHTRPDHMTTLPASQATPIEYPKHDDKVTFDLLTNLARSGTNHEDDQPIHLAFRAGHENDPVKSYQEFAGPEQRFCPAKVYEFNTDDPSNPVLIRNAQNCVHCKACDIKTPFNYIQWTVPEGGGGPAYTGTM